MQILQRNDFSPQFRYNPLIHLYHLGDVLFVISGENLFVFDPTNSHYIEEPNARDNQDANDAGKAVRNSKVYLMCRWTVRKAVKYYQPNFI